MLQLGYRCLEDWLQIRYGSLKKGHGLRNETVTFERFDSSNRFNRFNHIWILVSRTDVRIAVVTILLRVCGL